MNSEPERLNVLVMHADPIVCTGVIAALRENVAFNAFERRFNASTAEEEQRIAVVITDYATALRAVDRGSERTRGLPNDAKVLVLTPNDREADIRRAIEAGVFGYVLVGGPLDELVDGVAALAKGLRYMSPAVAHRMAESLTHATLSSRELEVLRLVADGEANKVIARELDIELGTVKAHVSAIMSKLGARSRTQAASIAAARGLISDARDQLHLLPIVGRAQSSQLRMT